MHKVRLLLSDELLQKEIDGKMGKLKDKYPSSRLRIFPREAVVRTEDILAHLEFQRRISELKKEYSRKMLSDDQAREDYKAICELFHRGITVGK